jgi:hypothetical protein
MGVEFNNMAAQSSTAIYKLLLSHIGQTVVLSTKAVIVTGILEAVQHSYATVKKIDGNLEYVVIGYVGEFLLFSFYTCTVSSVDSPVRSTWPDRPALFI